VKYNGRVFEAIAARVAGRRPCDLYHSALVVRALAGCFVVEQAPAARGDGSRRGVVRRGAVGSRVAGCLRLFRYEVRCWPNGTIPDRAEAIDSPRLLTDDPELARRVVDLVPSVPPLVWGRDELHMGEMWNSNSVISWVLARGGLDAESIQPPVGGRAPGWHAGLALARRQTMQGTRGRIRRTS
jgi:hypothetical protein